MTNAGKAATLPESQLLNRNDAANDDAVGYEQEVDEELEQDDVERTARENATGIQSPIMRSSKEMAVADDPRPPGKKLRSKLARLGQRR